MTTLDYELYEKKFKDVTLPHFVSGMSSILSFANSAATFGDKDLEEAECRKVKTDVKVAYEEMSRADREAKGIPMTVDYNKELNNTKRLVKTVESELHHLRAVVKENEEKMSNCNRQIPEKSKEIERLKESLSRKEREVEKMRSACGLLADIKRKLKDCYNYLLTLHGTVETLYNSCSNLYSLDPIMPIIEELFKNVLQQNSRNEILAYDENVQKMVKDVRMIQYQMNMK
ncbi:uncharacterized protein LOC144504277 isoform X2 [Mustelus asterias]